MNCLAPFARPLYVMAKPAGSLCNLHCEYCYYLEKKHLFQQPDSAGSRSSVPSAPLMDERTLEEFTCQYLQAQTQPQVLFTWHGGEPLMRPLSFYRRALALQQRYAHGRIIDNCLQTNGTLLTDEWCRFFRENNFLIGISIDGPRQFHDHYRRAQGGQPSFDKVIRGIRLLQKHGVEWNAMGVVNNCNADHPLDVYHFYKDLGCQYIQFAPVVERLLPHPDGRHLASPHEVAPLAPFSVRPGQYAHFCCTIFDEWVRHDVGQVFVQLFDATLARWAGQQPGVCTMCETCGHAAVIEANGDIYPCDHFVFPQYRLGNIHTNTIASLLYSPSQLHFGQSKRLLPTQCNQCEWLFACNGGCPKDRFHTQPSPQPPADSLGQRSQQPPANYLCPDYRQFFAHVAPYMDFMRHELLHQRPPANVMKAFSSGESSQMPLSAAAGADNRH